MVLLTLSLYLPQLFLARGVEQEITAINFVADTLLFAGAILTLARATPSAVAKIYTAFPAQKPEAQAH